MLFALSGASLTSAETYKKITSTDELESGAKYLIVYETGPYAFDGSLTTLDATSNYKSVTITDNTITTDEEIYFTITASGTSYNVESAQGYSIGTSSDKNSLLANKTTGYTNTISFNDDGTVNIISSKGAYLRFNKNSGDLRFRYYKSSSYTGQQAICLYKAVIIDNGKDTPTLSWSETEVSIEKTEEGVYTFPTLSATDKDNNDILSSLEITYKSSDESVATISTDGTITILTAGTTTITATSAATDDYNASSASYKLTVTVSELADGTTVFKLVTSESDIVAGKKYILASGEYVLGKVTSGTGGTAVKGTVSGDRIDVSSVDALILTLGGTTSARTFYSETNTYYLSLAKEKSLATSTDVVSWTINEDKSDDETLGYAITFTLSSTEYTLRYNSGVTTGTPFRCYSSTTGTKAYLYVQTEDDATTYTLNQDAKSYEKIEKSGVTVKVVRSFKQGWNAVVLPYAIGKTALTSFFGSEAEVANFTGADYNKDSDVLTLSFEQATSIEAGKPCLVYATEAVESITLTGVAEAANISDVTNGGYTMTGSYFTTTDNVINEGDIVVSGGKLCPTSTSMTCKGFRSYIKAPTGGSARTIVMNIGGETTSITEVSGMELSDGNCYDLSGRRVAQPTKSGIYVKEGKKIVVK